MSFIGMHMQRAWHLVDADSQVVGRVAWQVAQILRGRHKPTFMPNKDMGDHVVIINAEKVQFTGKQWDKKNYYFHTRYPGGLKVTPARRLLEKRPTDILRKAILGMIPRNRLRVRCIEKRLFIYPGPNHPHTTSDLPLSVPPLGKSPLSIKRCRRGGGVEFRTRGMEYYAHPDTFQWNPTLPRKFGQRIKLPYGKFKFEQKKWAKEQVRLEKEAREQREQQRAKEGVQYQIDGDPFMIY